MMRGIDQVFMGFGTFSVKDRPEKEGRSPSTGKPILIKAKRVPVFKAGSQLKKAVAQGKNNM
jgi:DNA-binding protein HU-beta